MENEIKCPHCGFENESYDFPELYYKGCGHGIGCEAEYDLQFEIQAEMQAKGYNVVTCGVCGGVILHRINRTAKKAEKKFTREEIKNMSPSEFEKYEEMILKQMRNGEIK